MGWFDEFTSGFDSAYKKAKDKEDFNKKSSSELKRMLEKEGKNLSWDEYQKIKKRIWEKESQEEYQEEYEKNRNRY